MPGLHFSTRFNKRSSACSPAPGTIGTILAAEPEDASIATDLEELTKPENLRKSSGFKDFPIRRIALRHFSDQATGPRGSRDRFDIEVLVLGDARNDYPILIHGFNHSYPLDPDLNHPPYRHLLSDPHINLIRGWMKTCNNPSGHSSCNKEQLVQRLPTRVLKSWLGPSDDDIRVQLIETDGNTKNQYACLSYCWGGGPANQIGQTLRRNIEQYKEAVPVEELPKTVVDAIRLCCKLGFEFLWVDRLCIVQDTDDWKIEASKMCEYYSKSALTISVPICSESSQSFLAEREKGFQEQSKFVVVEYSDDESGPRSSLWFTFFTLNEGSWFLENDWIHFAERRNREKPGWLGRGWTFQEWMISPRVLHISGLTLWDCFHGYANELDHREMKEATLDRSPERFGKDQGISWQSILEEYSKRQVTNRTDLLPALAGLAESYQSVTKSTYLAGIWKEEMPVSLMWQVQHDDYTNQEELTNQTTPSWSWAQSNSPIIYFFYSEEFAGVASISDTTECKYDPPGSISTVVEAWLDIDGLLSAVQRQRQENMWRQGQEDMWRQRRTEVKAGDEWWKSVPDNGDEYSERAIDQSKMKLLILVVSKEKQHDGTMCYGALVLRDCEREADGRSVFQRVGLASLDWDNKTESTTPGKSSMWERRSIRIV